MATETAESALLADVSEHLTADGALDAAFAPDIDFGSLGSTGAITSMALGADGSRLYLAGDFAKVGGLSRTQLAAVDARTGAVTGWLRDLVGGSYAQLTAEAASVPAGSRGLLLLPYFAGERTPLFDPAARGVLAGLTTGLAWSWARAVVAST